MKRVIFLILLFQCSTFLIAQSYQPTLVEGNQWIARRPTGFGNYVDYIYAANCDTMIGGESYKIAHMVYMDYLLGFYREDTTEQHIYKWNTELEQEELIIDFGLALGDSMNVFGHVLLVDSISYGIYYGKETKRIHFNSIQSFIEGIGYSFSGVHYFGAYTYLVGYSEDTQYCSPVTEVLSPDLEGIEVFPNPTTGEISIKGFGENSGLVTIYNQLGQIVKQDKLAEVMNIGDLHSGLYFLSIEGENKIFKIIKL